MVKDKPKFKFIKKPSQLNEEFRKLPKIKEEESEEEFFDIDKDVSLGNLDLGTINFTITFD